MRLERVANHRIDVDRTHPARELIDVLRARTFPPQRGAYCETPDGGRVQEEVEE